MRTPRVSRAGCAGVAPLDVRRPVGRIGRRAERTVLVHQLRHRCGVDDRRHRHNQRDVVPRHDRRVHVLVVEHGEGDHAVLAESRDADEALVDVGLVRHQDLVEAEHLGHRLHLGQRLSSCPVHPLVVPFRVDDREVWQLAGRAVGTRSSALSLGVGRARNESAARHDEDDRTRDRRDQDASEAHHTHVVTCHLTDIG